MAEPAFVGRRSIVGALQATGGVFRTAAAARGPLGVPSGSEVVTGRAGCLNWALPDLWDGGRVRAGPSRPSFLLVSRRGNVAGMKAAGPVAEGSVRFLLACRQGNGVACGDGTPPP